MSQTQETDGSSDIGSGISGDNENTDGEDSVDIIGVQSGTSSGDNETTEDSVDIIGVQSGTSSGGNESTEGSADILGSGFLETDDFLVQGESSFKDQDSQLQDDMLGESSGWGSGSSGGELVIDDVQWGSGSGDTSVENSTESGDICESCSEKKLQENSTILILVLWGFFLFLCLASLVCLGVFGVLYLIFILYKYCKKGGNRDTGLEWTNRGLHTVPRATRNFQRRSDERSLCHSLHFLYLIKNILGTWQWISRSYLTESEV